MNNDHDYNPGTENDEQFNEMKDLASTSGYANSIFEPAIKKLMQTDGQLKSSIDEAEQDIAFNKNGGRSKWISRNQSPNDRREQQVHQPQYVSPNPTSMGSHYNTVQAPHPEHVIPREKMSVGNKRKALPKLGNVNYPSPKERSEGGNVYKVSLVEPNALMI